MSIVDSVLSYFSRFLLVSMPQAVPTVIGDSNTLSHNFICLFVHLAYTVVPRVPASINSFEFVIQRIGTGIRMGIGMGIGAECTLTWANLVAHCHNFQFTCGQRKPQAMAMLMPMEPGA